MLEPHERMMVTASTLIIVVGTVLYLTAFINGFYEGITVTWQQHQQLHQQHQPQTLVEMEHYNASIVEKIVTTMSDVSQQIFIDIGGTADL
jgi:tRNA A37 N6-isopentenylltransferase MiaA